MDNRLEISTNPFDTSNNPFDQLVPTKPSTNPFDTPESNNPFDPTNFDVNELIELPVVLQNPTPKDLADIQIEHANLERTKAHLEKIAYTLNPDPSLLKRFMLSIQNMNIFEKVASYTLPLVPAGVMTGLKFGGVYVSSFAIGSVGGLGAALLVGFGFAHYLINDHMEKNQNIDEKYIDHIKVLGETLEIIIARLKLIHSELAEQTEIYKNENTELKSCNHKLEENIRHISQAIHQLESNTDDIAQDHVDLESTIEKIHKISETHKATNSDYEAVISNKSQQIEQIIQEKNNQFLLMSQQMELQSKKTAAVISTLNNTLEKIVACKAQNEIERASIKNRLDNIFSDAENNLKSICDNMNEQFQRFQSNVELMEKTNKQYVDLVNQKVESKPAQSTALSARFLPSLSLLSAKRTVETVTPVKVHENLHRVSVI